MAVCLIECQLCGEQYTGSTKTKFVCETAKVCEQRGSSKASHKTKTFSWNSESLWTKRQFQSKP